MKKVLLGAIGALLLLAWGCSGQKALDKIPADYSLEQAKEDGCIVHENGDIICGQELWQQFLKQTQAGEQASVRLGFYYSQIEPDECAPGVYEKLPEEEKKASLFLKDLEFDGQQYTLTFLDQGQLSTRVYEYLMLYEEEAPNAGSSYETCTRYVLTHTDKLTWQQIEWSMLSAAGPGRIEHDTVYRDYKGREFEP